MKYYVFQDTSLALTWTYRELDISDRPDIMTGLLELKHRLIPAYETVSPYLLGGFGARRVEYIPEPEVDDDFSEMIFSFGLGIDFMMNDHFAFVFEGTWNITEAIDEEETPDWGLFRIGMQYYWQ